MTYTLVKDVFNREDPILDPSWVDRVLGDRVPHFSHYNTNASSSDNRGCAVGVYAQALLVTPGSSLHQQAEQQVSDQDDSLSQLWWDVPAGQPASPNQAAAATAADISSLHNTEKELQMAIEHVLIHAGQIGSQMPQHQQHSLVSSTVFSSPAALTSGGNGSSCCWQHGRAAEMHAVPAASKAATWGVQNRIPSEDQELERAVSADSAADIFGGLTDILDSRIQTLSSLTSSTSIARSPLVTCESTTTAIVVELQQQRWQQQDTRWLQQHQHQHQHQ